MGTTIRIFTQVSNDENLLMSGWNSEKVRKPGMSAWPNSVPHTISDICI